MKLSHQSQKINEIERVYTKKENKNWRKQKIIFLLIKKEEENMYKKVPLACMVAFKHTM